MEEVDRRGWEERKGGEGEIGGVNDQEGEI